MILLVLPNGALAGRIREYGIWFRSTSIKKWIEEYKKDAEIPFWNFSVVVFCKVELENWFDKIEDFAFTGLSGRDTCKVVISFRDFYKSSVSVVSLKICFTGMENALIHGIKRPPFVDFLASIKAPMIGSLMASQILVINRIVPTCKGFTFNTSV